MGQLGIKDSEQQVLNSSFDPDFGVLATLDPGLALRVDDYTTANVTYIGKAIAGTATSEAKWRICKMDETQGVVMTFADGDIRADNVWDNRASLSYS